MTRRTSLARGLPRTAAMSAQEGAARAGAAAKPRAATPADAAATPRATLSAKAAHAAGIAPAARPPATLVVPAARNAQAAGTVTAQTVRVALVWQLADGVLVVIATTLKRGARYYDSWSISPSLALVSVTAIDRSLPHLTSYVSRASVTDFPPSTDTTYTFSYAIVMRARERVWVGSGSVTVTVGPDGSPAPSPGGMRRVR